MTRIILLVLTLLPLAAAAQVVRMPVCSPWTVWASETAHSFAASPLQTNALGNLAAIPGQRVAIGPIKFLQPSVGVTFKGPAASSATGFRVTAIRVHHEAGCLNMTMGEHPIDHLLPAPLLVPPGQPFSCRYDMPLVGYGELICAVGKMVPDAAPAPPPITPPVGASPNGTRIPPAAQIVDGTGAVWTPTTQIGGTATQVGCLRNGVRVCDSVDLMTIKDGVVYHLDGTWARWTGSGWISSPAP